MKMVDIELYGILLIYTEERKCECNHLVLFVRFCENQLKTPVCMYVYMCVRCGVHDQSYNNNNNVFFTTADLFTN